MWSFVIGSSNVSDTSVSSQNDNWSGFTFQSSVQKWETFHIQHMDLINEQDSWDNLGLSFFSPFWNFLVDLLSDFLSNFSSCAWEQCQKSLWSGVNNIDFVKSNSMYDLFSLFNLSFWAVYESGLRPHCVILRSSCEASTSFWDFTWSFINCDNITCNNFLFLNGFNHFLTQIINCLHFGSF